MAVKLLPSEWSNTSAYSVGDVVQYEGIRFECIVAVSMSTSGNRIPVDNTSWQFDGVLRLVDYYSIQYAVEFEVNSDNDVINNSIPAYVQNVERKLSKLLRSPAQKVTRRFTLMNGRDNEALFDIPEDLLDVVHLRFNTDDSGYNLESQGAITIQKTDRSSFERLRQRYISNGYYVENINEFDYPVYVMDDEMFQISPRPDDSVTEVEMTYYQQVPELGSVVNLVDNDYNPINSAGQTSAEWQSAGRVVGTASYVANATSVSLSITTIGGSAPSSTNSITIPSGTQIITGSVTLTTTAAITVQSASVTVGVTAVGTAITAGTTFSPINVNTAENFVQDTETVTKNLWTATTPHLLKAGALVEAYSYEDNADRLAIAREQFAELLQMTQIEFRKADASGAHASIMSSPYAIE